MRQTALSTLNSQLATAAPTRPLVAAEPRWVTDECQCEEVNVAATEIINGEEAELPTLAATVVPSEPKSLKLDSSPRDRALAEKIWEARAEDEDVHAKLARRRQRMRTLGAELEPRSAKSANVVFPALAPSRASP